MNTDREIGSTLDLELSSTYHAENIKEIDYFKK